MLGGQFRLDVHVVVSMSFMQGEPRSYAKLSKPSSKEKAVGNHCAVFVHVLYIVVV